MWGTRSHRSARVHGVMMLLVGTLAAATGVFAVASPASARAFRGQAVGSLSCSLAARIHFSPPISMAGGGTAPSSVVGTLSGCATHEASLVIQGGALTGTFTHSPIDCASLSATRAPASLRVQWTASVEGRVHGAPYSGAASLRPSRISVADESMGSSSTGHGAIALPGRGGATVRGSFPGTAWAVVYSADTLAAFAAACQSPSGVSNLAVSGTVTLGSPADGTSAITGFGDPSTVNDPARITAGPDGAMWFTNWGTDSIGRIGTDGTVTDFTDPSIASPEDITTGPDGALWFANWGNGSIGRISTDGTGSAYSTAGVKWPFGIVTGPDGAMWFTDPGSNQIGRITTSGAISLFSDPSLDFPLGIATGPDGALWFTNAESNTIGRISTAGAVSQFGGDGISYPLAIAAGPDGGLWFTNWGSASSGSIGRISTTGALSIVNDPAIDSPNGIAAGPDGRMWFANYSGNSIGAVSPDGTVTTYTDLSIFGPDGIAAGPDGAMWFTNFGNDTIGRIQAS